MGLGYELKCTSCGWMQNLRTSGGFNYRQDHKAHLISRLSKEAKSELNQIEEIYNVSDNNVRVFTSIGRCGECYLLREILTFVVYLSKSFKLINSGNYYCNNCRKNTDESFGELKESCYTRSRCPKCKNLGLKITNRTIYD